MPHPRLIGWIAGILMHWLLSLVFGQQKSHQPDLWADFFDGGDRSEQIATGGTAVLATSVTV
jgi:hypothetical protein